MPLDQGAELDEFELWHDDDGVPAQNRPVHKLCKPPRSALRAQTAEIHTRTNLRKAVDVCRDLLSVKVDEVGSEKDLRFKGRTASWTSRSYVLTGSRMESTLVML